MNYQHKSLAAGRWKELSFFKQMANIGSEVQRAINWKEKKSEQVFISKFFRFGNKESEGRIRNKEYSQMAIDRALELLDMTIKDEKNHKRSRLKELLRLREFLVDYFYFDNIYKSNSSYWQNYFLAFSYAANNKF